LASLREIKGMLKIDYLFGCLLFALFLTGNSYAADADKEIRKTEKWELFEIILNGPILGNPFEDVRLRAVFSHEKTSVEVEGFCDGDGVYKIRFMPEFNGKWSYKTSSNKVELNGKDGKFEVFSPALNNHGPVRVKNKFHFAYADGKPFKPFGTTCYAWNHQSERLMNVTLETLAKSPFNKIRMCVFPKYYEFNREDPELFPFEGNRGNFDLSKFNVKYFQRLDRCIIELKKIGVEADLILFHPYDKGRWGFDRMNRMQDERYLRYVVSRYSAFRNIWWSVANEFDYMEKKNQADWDAYLGLIKKHDPYAKLCSIHNGSVLFDHTNPILSHASIQNGSAVEDFGRAGLLRDAYQKPVIYDEVKYEGNITQRWGKISAQEMVHRFWQGVMAGTYVTHGETIHSADQVLWWSKGGVLRGQSPERIGFLRKVLEDGPEEGINLIDPWQVPEISGKSGEYYLVYFGKKIERKWELVLPKVKVSKEFSVSVEILDTWNMTQEMVAPRVKIEPRGRYELAPKEKFFIDLPGKPYLALRIRKIAGQ